MIAVLFLRLILKRAPKWISYALWSLVLFRLVCPVSISSAFSIFGRIGKTGSTGGGLEHIPENIGMMPVPQVDIGSTSVNTVINNALPAAAPAASANPLQIIIFIGACIWLTGVALMILYSVVSYLRLKRRMMEATLVSGNIFETDKISSPFVCGFIKPKIYMPIGLSGNERDYVLRHEQTHISRRDCIIKPLAFLVLSVHWFNPFMWLAFILMSRDLEMSCDEKVVSELDSEGKAGYSSALMQLAMKRPVLAGSPLAFGESGAKGRVRNVLNYKKPAFWVLAAAVMIIIIAGIGLLTNPISRASSDGEISPDEIRQLAQKGGTLPQESTFDTSWDRQKANGAPYMTTDDSEKWRQRLQADIPGVGEYQVGGVYSSDFDGNGASDLMVLLYSAGGLSHQSYLCVYMNDDPVYTDTFDGTPVFGFEQYPVCGDIDNDGYPEIVFNIFTGGNGGAGSSVKGVLKYKPHFLAPMNLPGDDSEDFIQNDDVGYQVKVLFGGEKNEYKAVCEGLGKAVAFKAQNAVNEDGAPYRLHIAENEEAGANCRGYSAFSAVNRNGKSYLMAEEYLYGETGTADGVGFATFLIEWDGSGNPYVAEFGVSDKSMRSD
jgi:beta-lactamase regulating signal transducer with metallopeptidase domain